MAQGHGIAVGMGWGGKSVAGMGCGWKGQAITPENTALVSCPRQRSRFLPLLVAHLSG